MFVRAQSKQRFGDVKEPFINIDQIVSVELGHDHNLFIKMTNQEELVVSGERAQKLLAYLEANQVK